MQLLDVAGVGENYSQRWGDGSAELYPHWIDYRAIADDGEHHVRICFGTRLTYGRDRKRVIVLIDGHPHVEFLGADDFERSGDVLAEIKIAGTAGEPICRYPDEAIPERYSGLPTVGLRNRVSGSGVHNAWAVVTNIADHRVMFARARCVGSNGPVDYQLTSVRITATWGDYQ